MTFTATVARGLFAGMSLFSRSSRGRGNLSAFRWPWKSSPTTVQGAAAGHDVSRRQGVASASTPRSQQQLEQQEESAGMDMTPLYYSVQKEIPEPMATKIKGEVPTWINGSLIRNGPGKFEVGKDSYNHLFDGLSLLTRFNINDGKVTYQSRFQRSDAYVKAMEANRIVMSEFGTFAHPDPCLSMFSRFMSWFQPTEFTDNCNVNCMAIGDQCFAMTETKDIRKIDPVTLETLDKIDMSKKMVINTATAHPHFGNDGTVYNLGSHFAKQTHYNIMHIPPPEPGAESDPLSKASILCSIPASGKLPSYYHSFGMTDNYIVFLEQPLVLNILMLRFPKLFKKRGFSSALQFQEKQSPRLHLVRRDTGELLSQKYLTDSFFCFHHINAYEESGHVVVDLCCYKDESIIQSVSLEEMRKGAMNTESTAMRFVLPLNPEKKTGVNLNSLEYSKASSVLKDDGSVHCTPEVILDDKFVELPRVNYEKYNGKPYQYFYGISSSFSELVKVDTRTAKSIAWREDGAVPSEPVFIASPGSTSEDDGVVIASTISLDRNKPSFLLVLDARDMKEIARAEIDAEVPYGIHGMYLEN